ncbi:MAG: biotin--[acetyl-CoA-carboxylase] ligase [bacterium]
MQKEISRVVDELSRFGQLSLPAWPASLPFSAEQFGLERVGEVWQWSLVPQPFDVARIERALSEHNLTCFECVDSTNTQMVDLGRQRSIAGQVYLAEFQFGGKGRRGRHWMSPFGRNLAISLGFATHKPLNELGGMSLVVGLALAEVLDAAGVEALTLKWPNDLLLAGRKLGGVLIELIQRGHHTEFVVGFGLNLALTPGEIAAIGQPVADLRSGVHIIDRSQLAVACVQTVNRYLTLFEDEGFAPFVRAFNDLHFYQGKNCTLIQGDQSIVGRVEGVGLDGELILVTQHGEERFHGGEVSLRSSSP